MEMEFSLSNNNNNNNKNNNNIIIVIEMPPILPEYKHIKNVKVKKKYKLFASRVNGMCLKKYYNSVSNYLALVLAVLGSLLILTITKLAVSSDESQSWQELEVNDQALHHLHIHFFIDQGAGESISMFTNVSKNMAEAIENSLQLICNGCIATYQEPSDFFNAMPYKIQTPIPMKYLINDIYKTKQRMLSFTYGLPELREKLKVASGKIRRNKTLTIYYNTEAFHSSFRSLNFGHNLALLSTFQNESIRISVSTTPMEIAVSDKLIQHNSKISNMELYFTIGTCLPFLVSSFIIFVITDRTSNMKSMQHVAGISIWMYWIVNFVWDFITYCIIISIFSLPMIKLRVDGFHGTEFCFMFGFMLVFGIFALPFVYCLSLFFSNEIMGYLATTAICVACGTYNYLIEIGLFHNSEFYTKIAMLFPQFAILRAIEKIHLVGLKKHYCKQEADYLSVKPSFVCDLNTGYECCPKTLRQLYWNWGRYGLNSALTTMCIDSLLCFIFLFTYEYIVIVRKLSPFSIVKLYSYLLPDTDPKYRKRKLAIAQLTKEEKREYRVVINNLEGEVSKHTNFFRTLSFVLKEGKSFGIVGHLNSGSVELCRKIGGLDKFVLGEITINGFDMGTQRRLAQKYLSISIQHDKVACSMSAYEYLEVLCYCRGVSGNQIPWILYEIFDALYMKQVMFHSISSFDQCYIKKLSFAAALIGEINIMIIDQPTATLDPLSKIAIWNAILFARSIGKTIIFSSDSLSEADIIADDILLLLEGSIVGLASPTELRITFCKGFHIEFRMAMEGRTVAEVEENISINLVSVRQFFQYLCNTSKELKSMSSGCYLYFVPLLNLDWIKVINIIENNQARLGIHDYIMESRSLKDIMYKHQSD